MLNVDGLRALAERYMTDTAAIYRPTSVADGAGGRTATAPTLVATVAARLSRPGGGAADSEMATGARLTLVQTWRLRLPAGTDLQAQDRVTINGRTFEVADPGQAQTWQAQRTASIVEVS